MWQIDAGTQETGFSSNFADPKNVVTKSITWDGQAKDFEMFDFRFINMIGALDRRALASMDLVKNLPIGQAITNMEMDEFPQN
jgi:hypothetical protein